MNNIYNNILLNSSDLCVAVLQVQEVQCGSREQLLWHSLVDWVLAHNMG